MFANTNVFSCRVHHKKPIWLFIEIFISNHSKRETAVFSSLSSLDGFYSAIAA